MRFPRFFSARFASVLALGCALLALAAPASAQTEPHFKVLALDNAVLGRLDKFVDAVKADPADNAAVSPPEGDEEFDKAFASGESLDKIINTKYPKIAAVFKKRGYAVDEFYSVLISLHLATEGITEGASDLAVAKANIAFVKANKETVDAIIAKLE